MPELYKDCPQCGGRVIASGIRCFNCGYEYPAGAPDTLELDLRGNPPTFVRTYYGTQPAEAHAKMGRDGPTLADRGYFPVSQDWSAGQWTGAETFIVIALFVAAFVLIFFDLLFALLFLVPGFLLLVYMLLVKPTGTLAVTYELRAAVSGPGPAPAPATAGVMALLGQLGALHAGGVLTDTEFETKKAELLARL